MKHALHDEIVAERRAEQQVQRRAAIRGVLGLGAGTPVRIEARGRPAVFADVVGFDGARVSLTIWETAKRWRVAFADVTEARTAYVERRASVERIASKRTDRGER